MFITFRYKILNTFHICDGKHCVCDLIISRFQKNRVYSPLLFLVMIFHSFINNFCVIVSLFLIRLNSLGMCAWFLPRKSFQSMRSLQLQRTRKLVRRKSRWQAHLQLLAGLLWRLLRADGYVPIRWRPLPRGLFCVLSACSSDQLLFPPAPSTIPCSNHPLLPLVYPCPI